MVAVFQIISIITMVSACGAESAKQAKDREPDQVDGSPRNPDTHTPVDQKEAEAEGEATGEKEPIDKDSEYLPLVLGALGDSITKGFNAESFLTSSIELSWSTGAKPKTKTGSHLSLFRSNFEIESISAYNFARVGSTSSDLANQVEKIIPKKLHYVTLLTGANDVCGWPTNHAAALEKYKDNIDDAVIDLLDALPDIKINIVAVPDLNRLHALKRGDANCQAIWDFAGGCQDLLSTSASASDREAFHERWQDMNSALREVAEAHEDNAQFSNKTASYEFEAKHISQHDCFHPSAAGQEILSEESWDADFAVEALRKRN